MPTLRSSAEILSLDFAECAANLPSRRDWPYRIHRIVQILFINFNELQDCWGTWFAKQTKNITILNKKTNFQQSWHCLDNQPFCRRGHTVLRQSLPQKTEHVLFVRMTDTQVVFYQMNDILVFSYGHNYELCTQHDCHIVLFPANPVS